MRARGCPKGCSTLGADFLKSADKFQVGQCLLDALLDFWRRLARGEHRPCPLGRYQRFGPLLRLFEPRHLVQDQLKLPRYFRLRALCGRISTIRRLRPVRRGKT